MNLPDAIYKAIKNLSDGGQKEVAYWLMSKLLADYPNNAQHHCEMAAIANELGKLEVALNHYKQAAHLDKENTIYLKNLSDFYSTAIKDYQRALECNKKVLEIDPQNVSTRIACGKLCLNLGERADAGAFFISALQIDPLNKDARQLISCLEEDSKAAGPLSLAAKQTDPSMAKKAAGNLCGDIHHIGQLLAVSPDDPKAQSEFLKKLVDNLIESEHIEGWLAPAEAFILYSMSLRNDDAVGRVVEIGSFLGKSSYWLAKAAKERNGDQVYCIDTFQGSKEHEALLKGKSTFNVFRNNLVKAGVFNWSFPLIMSSKEAYHSFKEKIGLLFIDGSHEYEDVRSDLLNWEQHLNEGGTVILHDSTGQWDGPTKVAEELIISRKHKYTEVIQVHSMTIAKKIT